MSKSLKDALMEAGFRTKKSENERPQVRKKEKTQAQEHQEVRNFCEFCENIYPDVEHYNHRNPTIDARWICVACADKNEIDDRFRTTQQSQFAQQGRFKRYYGATRDLKKEAMFGAGKSNDNRGNRPGNGPGQGRNQDRNNNDRRNDRDQGPKRPFNKDRR